MTTIDVRELQEHTPELLRRVRDRGETLDVADQGQVIARIVPARHSSTSSTTEWSRRADELAAQIGARWPEGISAVDAVRELRRDG